MNSTVHLIAVGILCVVLPVINHKMIHIVSCRISFLPPPLPLLVCPLLLVYLRQHIRCCKFDGIPWMADGSTEISLYLKDNTAKETSNAISLVTFEQCFCCSWASRWGFWTLLPPLSVHKVNLMLLGSVIWLLGFYVHFGQTTWRYRISPIVSYPQNYLIEFRLNMVLSVYIKCYWENVIMIRIGPV